MSLRTQSCEADSHLTVPKEGNRADGLGTAVSYFIIGADGASAEPECLLLPCGATPTPLPTKKRVSGKAPVTVAPATSAKFNPPNQARIPQEEPRTTGSKLAQGDSGTISAAVKAGKRIFVYNEMKRLSPAGTNQFGTSFNSGTASSTPLSLCAPTD